MFCQRGGLVIQRHNEKRDLLAELLDMVCYDVQVEPALQPITGEKLARGTTKPLIHALTSTVGVSGGHGHCGLVQRS